MANTPHHHDDELLRRFRSADPVEGSISDSHIDRLVARGIQQGSRPTQKRISAFGVFALATAAAITLGGIMAVPSIAETIRFLAQDVPENSDPRMVPSSTPNPTSSPVEGGSEIALDAEWVDPAADDYVQWALANLDLTLPLPPNMDAVDVATQRSQNWHDQALANYGQGGVIVQDIGQQGDWAQLVQCVWMEEWLDADKAGEKKRKTAAQSTLADSMAWPALLKLIAPDDTATAAHRAEMLDAFTTGNRDGIKDAYSSNDCSIHVEGVDR